MTALLLLPLLLPFALPALSRRALVRLAPVASRRAVTARQGDARRRPEWRRLDFTDNLTG